jgi:hypothetical protein
LFLGGSPGDRWRDSLRGLREALGAWGAGGFGTGRPARRNKLTKIQCQSCSEIQRQRALPFERRSSLEACSCCGRGDIDFMSCLCPVGMRPIEQGSGGKHWDGFKPCFEWSGQVFLGCVWGVVAEGPLVVSQWRFQQEVHRGRRRRQGAGKQGSLPSWLQLVQPASVASKPSQESNLITILFGVGEGVAMYCTGSSMYNRRCYDSFAGESSAAPVFLHHGWADSGLSLGVHV